MKALLLFAAMLFIQESVYAQRSQQAPGRTKTDLHVVHDSLIYFSSVQLGVFQTDGRNLPISLQASLPAATYYSVRQLNNELWLGSSLGLGRLQNGVFTQFNTTLGGFPADTVFQLLVVNNQLVAATNAGLVLRLGQNWVIYNSNNSGLSSNRVLRLKAQGQRLGLVAGGSAYLFENGQIRALNVPTADSITAVQPIAGNEVIVLTKKPVYRVNAAGTVSGIMGINSAHDVQPKGDSLLFLINNRIYVLHNNEIHLWNLIPNGGLRLSPTTVPAFFQHSAQGKTYALYETTLIINDSLMQMDDTENSVNRRYLDINQVKALYLNGGDMFWDRGTTNNARYNVPKEHDTVQSARHTMFALSPWFGGKSNNQLHQTGQLYRQSSVGGLGYRSGPLDTLARPFAEEVRYDRLWKINRYDVEAFKNAWQRGLVQNGSYYPNFDFRDWPGNRPDGSKLAPFFDFNNDGIYRYTDGDYPIIKGDQAIWMVFHDKVPNRTQNAPPLGIEVQCMAYAYVCNQTNTIDSVLNYTTFLDYKVINKSLNTYNDSYFAVWADGDIGFAMNDYVGMDVQGNGFYFYNGEPQDSCRVCYGANPPAQGVYLLKGPTAIANDGKDNNRNGMIDELEEDVAFSSFMYFNNDNTVIGNPTISENFYQYSRGIWKDDSAMVYGGNAYPGSPGATNLTTKFRFPGSSDPVGWGLGGTTQNPIIAPFAWTETNNGSGSSANIPSDRRGIGAMGELLFPPKDEKSFTLALIYSRGTNGPLSSVQKLLTQDAPRIKQWHALGQFPSCLDLSTVSVPHHHGNELNALVYPNPFGNALQLKVANENELKLRITDIQGRVLIDHTFAGALQYELHTQALSAGIYVVHLQQAGASKVVKLVKQ